MEKYSDKEVIKNLKLGLTMDLEVGRRSLNSYIMKDIDKNKNFTKQVVMALINWSMKTIMPLGDTGFFFFSF